MPSIRAPLSSLNDHDVFAVDSVSAQLLVRSSADSVVLHVDDRDFVERTTAGVAVFDVTGLEPDTIHRATIDIGKPGDHATLLFRTRSDPGPIHTRFATISDVHLGLEEFGVGRKLTDSGSIPYALRCARAAVEEAQSWGAELLVIKGDLTETGQRFEWDLVEQLFDGVETPVLFTPGNHDVTRKQQVSREAAAATLGTDHRPVQVHDVPGLRIVVADTSRDRRGTGDLARVGSEIVEAADCGTPVFVTFHHNIQRAPVPWFWPPGISSTNAAPVVRALAEANPATFLSSGHTHRNRLHWLGPERSIPYTEVSSTSDYPGVWAGYEVSDTTVRQTVRRIAAPSAIEWTERTRAVLGGVWPRWSQGRIDDRCVDLTLTPANHV